jgi:Holliday junction resolvase RusA-like endonuclease
MVEFIVHGIPAPQGSKTKWGTEDNPNTRPWRAAVAAQAAETMGETPLLEGALVLEVYFHFPRPKSHYRTGKNAHLLKDAAPMFHAAKPDVDKLVRAIGDALTGIVVRDDAQFSGVVATKRYGAKACAHVVVREVQPFLERAIRDASEAA